MSSPPIERDSILAAAERIAPHLVQTPALESAWLSDRLGARVVVKWESLQRTGSFKLRGALNKTILLAEAGARRVLAVSAGNHGLGVAWAARRLGLSATVVVPAGAAPNKVAAIRALGAEVLVRGDGYDQAEVAARALARAGGTPFVSPYNDPDVIAGQATATLELLDAESCDLLLVPAGGGGLLAGAVAAAATRDPAPRVLGVQPAHAPALHAALAAGRRVVVSESPTLADGLAGNLEEGTITLPLLAGRVEDVLLVSEDAIAAAIRGFLEHEHHVVEGSGAVGAAAILEGLVPRNSGTVGLLVTGRNIDLEVLRRILA